MHYLSQSRLAKEILLMKTRYPDLELGSNGVNIPVNKQGRTPLVYITNVVDAFKRIKKGSNYHWRILVQKKPKERLANKDKMEKRFDITQRQGYVNKVAGMLNQRMVPVNNDNILHQLILEKTKSGEVIRGGSNQDWNGIC